MLVSKLGVVRGESLADDMEGCGDELVLNLACAPGGGWPRERVEIIRPVDEEIPELTGDENPALDIPTCLRTNSFLLTISSCESVYALRQTNAPGCDQRLSCITVNQCEVQ